MVMKEFVRRRTEGRLALWECLALCGLMCVLLSYAFPMLVGPMQRDPNALANASPSTSFINGKEMFLAPYDALNSRRPHEFIPLWRWKTADSDVEPDNV